MKDDCQHRNFVVTGRVGRLLNTEETEVIDWILEVEVHCADCMMPFLFKGLPGGLLKDSPTANVENTEARMPIEPAWTPDEPIKP